MLSKLYVVDGYWLYLQLLLLLLLYSQSPNEFHRHCTTYNATKWIYLTQTS